MTMVAPSTELGPRAQKAASAVKAPLTPANLAMAATDGTTSLWYPYAWLRLLNRKLMELAKAREAFARTGKVTGIHFLIVEAPVRHGKSELGSVYFPAWWLGTFPDDRVILTGNNAELAEGFSRRVRNLLRDHGRTLFGADLRVSLDSSSVARWDLAAPRRGGLVAVGVGSPPTGKGAHLLVVDDPIKSDLQAYSTAWRESLWRWWLFSIRSRLEPGGVCVIIMSRWHEDDLVGRLLKRQKEADRKAELEATQATPLTDEDAALAEREKTIEDVVDRWEVLHLPALAEPTEDDPDPLERDEGEALCPERYDRAALLRLRDGPLGVGPVAFRALYQNSPTTAEGSVFKVEKFGFVPEVPLDPDIRWIRRWDLAATEKEQQGDPDWTAGVLMGRYPSGYIIVADVRRVRRNSGPVEQSTTVEAFMRATAFEDQARLGRRIKIRAAQDPGASGKALARAYQRTVFAGFDYTFDPEGKSGDKLARATPFANQLEAGNVTLVEGPWNYDWIEELRGFPLSPHDDQVDAAANAYLDLAGLTKTKVKLLL